MRVINLYGGPGTGKSTTAAAVFAELKHAGYNAELAREWPKGPVWDGYKEALKDQVYILGKHYRDLCRYARGGVEVVVTDAPLLMSLVYGNDMPVSFRALTLELYRDFDNMDVFLLRSKAFNPAGRVQDEAAARELDGSIRRIIGPVAGLSTYTTFANKDATNRIVDHYVDIYGIR